MQFMSQATGWADSIILAMAPLGIITIIVAAIRVGGPFWLGSVIGRARENRAVPEAELMSSTSYEVRELWNGQEIVRVMGQGPIREFIILIPEDKTKDEKETEEGREGHMLEVRAMELKDPPQNEQGVLGAMWYVYLSPQWVLFFQSSVLAWAGVATYYFQYPKDDKEGEPVAWVRRNFNKNPEAVPLTAGFELDWLVMTLEKHRTALWFLSKSDEDCGQLDESSRPWAKGDDSWDWRVAAVQNRNNVKMDPDEHKSESRPQRLMRIRRELGKLAGWAGVASAEAISLTRAIEFTMDTLFSHGPIDSGDMWWSLTVSGEPVYFRLSWKAGHWTAYSDELDSVLPLWMYSAHEKEQRKHTKEGDNTKGDDKSKTSDQWLSDKGTSKKPSLQILAIRRPRNTQRYVSLTSPTYNFSSPSLSSPGTASDGMEDGHPAKGPGRASISYLRRGGRPRDASQNLRLDIPRPTCHHPRD
ncbi:uncharacterized protein PODANS_1_8220 [Podospora anserina S mat+]|uniref:Podospora anserina S mat+ genomic DNA chromosome 1, supercontig 1 n=1 Tax=Podospora anserina (strain S / ATCC MYA-4624 / DSM 980 / FGSC 10383) TaxID=515849 RepID=B2A927_PODAN|nr:uncharacterized protein PODANS_1_8220 [Podospora anserina S mat+]CAP60528.1 unnamed protein product [Podospora anserina S mat+]CDP23171.1 Putative protein of unknown function [Podospora anserina S mat+]